MDFLRTRRNLKANCRRANDEESAAQSKKEDADAALKDAQAEKTAAETGAAVSGSPEKI